MLPPNDTASEQATLPFRDLLRLVIEERRTLTRGEARAVLRDWLTVPGAATEQGGTPPVDEVSIAALLAAMTYRGETAAELTGFAEAMRAVATPLPLTGEERARLVDTCGTGGDGHGTFNISTGAALVAAAAGASVAKHGNRAVTSRCGSADVLEALGIPISLAPVAAVECLRVTGFLFLLATALHPAMRRVAPVRRALGFRTLFNLAGPLTNPAGAEAQVMGVYAASKIEVVAEAMALLGVRHAFVVHGDTGAPAAMPGARGGAGLDELTITGTSHVAEVRRSSEPAGAAAVVRRFTLEPEQLGFGRAPLSALGGGESAEESAGVLLAIFRGDERGPRRDIVTLNAAAALVAGGVATDLAEGVARANAALDAGRPLQLVDRLRAFGHRYAGEPG